MASKKQANRHASRRARIIKGGVLAASAAVAVAAVPAASALADTSNNAPHQAIRNNERLVPDSVVISGTVFPRRGVNLQIGDTLPFATNWTDPAPEPAPVLARAVAPGQYPYIFNNDGPDGSFAVQTPIDLWDVSLGGKPLGTVHVPTDEMTTSFSSKSELAINLSTNGQDLSFSGYGAPVGEFDASNSNTPGTFDASNPDLQGENSTLTAGGVYRVTGALSSEGHWTYTETNSYSGDNERAVLLDSADNVFFASGNSNNGNSSPIDPALVDGTGAQAYPESFLPEAAQDPAGGTSLVPLGAFNIQNVFPMHKADKAGKDTNFRGLTVSGNVVYYTKGSGSNGINTVYFVDTSGEACATTNGVGVPAMGAQLPQPGVTYPMCVLAGFNTNPAKSETTNQGDPVSSNWGSYPFGIWFANADTVYVADEGNGDNAYDSLSNTYPNAQEPSVTYPAGLEKYTFNGSTWVLDYTLENGLDLGVPYTVKGYPTGDNDTDGGTGLPWAPATDGLRNISGHVNGNGTVTIYATTSTVSGSGDQGADPNKVVAVTDTLGATDPSTAGAESFTTIARPVPGVRYGGVAVLPPDFGAAHGSGQNQSKQ